MSRKEQIELKATELFREKGYSATSMRDLAQNLGIEAASIYSHIRSKEELLQNICFRMAQEFFDALEAIENTCDNAADRLASAIIAHVEVITKNPAASAVFFDEWRHMGEPSLSVFLKMRQDYEAGFHQIVETGIAEGIFVEADPKLVVITILSSLNWIYQGFNPAGKMSAQEIGQFVADMMMKGLRKS